MWTAFIMFMIASIALPIMIDRWQEDTMTEEEKKDYKNSMTENLEYLSGVDGIYDIVPVQINIGYKNNFEVFFHKNKYRKNNFLLSLKDIKSIDIKTEEQISHDVTIPRAVLLGVFALGLKKERRYMEKYLIINYTDENNKDNTIIFRGNNAPNIKRYYDEKIKNSQLT